MLQRKPPTLLPGVILALALAAPGPVAAGISILPHAKMGRTRVAVGDLYTSRIWVTSFAGDLLSRREAVSAGAWKNHGIMVGGYPAGLSGATAVSYDFAGTIYEAAFFVGTNGTTTRIYEKRIIGGVEQPYLELIPAATPTGEIEAFTGVVGGTRYVVLLFVATDGNVYRYMRTATGAWGGPMPTNCGVSVSTDAGGTLASAVSPNEQQWFGFARSATNTLRVMRWNGTAWSCSDQGAPSVGGVSSAMDAESGLFGGTAWIVRLYATPLGATYGLWTKTFTSTSGNWGGWVIVPGGPNVNHNIRDIAVTHRVGSGGYDRLVTFVTDTTDFLWMHEWEATPVGWTALSRPAEVAQIYGGMMARPAATYAVAYFTAQLGVASYLASRTTSSAPTTGPWYIHGSNYRVNELFPLTSNHAENFVANYKGEVLASGVVRPGAEIPAYVESRWSSDDGLTWAAPVQPPVPIYIPHANGYDYVSDSTTALWSGGGFFMALGLEWPTPADICVSYGNLEKTIIYLFSTVDGTYGVDPMWSMESDGFLDHPWMALNRVTGRLHIVWQDQAGVVEYCYIEGAANTCATPFVLSAANVGGSGVTGPPTMILDAAGVPYITAKTAAGTAIYMCRLSTGFGGEMCCAFNSSLVCRTAPNVPVNLTVEVAAIYNFDVPVSATCPANSCSGSLIRAEQAWSLGASPTSPGRLYYAVTTSANGGRDIVVGTSPTGASGTWSNLGSPTPFPADDTDQFLPAINVTSSGPYDELFVSWYDRRYDMFTCHNHYIYPMYAVSGDSGLTWSGPFFLRDAEDATDPCALPRHCVEGSLFIGDYHETVAERFHTHLHDAEAPIGSPLYTAKSWEAFVSASDYRP